jgi:hypothetical protein
MKTIRIGLVGFGSWPQQAYAPVLNELPDVRVVTVAAKSENTHRLARETFGDGIAVSSDYRELLADDDIDASMISLPNALHSEALLPSRSADGRRNLEERKERPTMIRRNVIYSVHTSSSSSCIASSTSSAQSCSSVLVSTA